MTDERVARLEEKRRQEIAKAVDTVLAEGDPAAVQRHLQTVDACGKLLAALPPPRKRDWMLPAGVALACLAVASSLWTLRVRRTDVAASFESSGLAARLAQPWTITEAPGLTAIRVEGVSAVEAPNLGISSLRDVPSGGAWVALEGGAISLAKMTIAAGAGVDVVTRPDEVVIYVRDAPVDATIEVGGRAHIAAGPAMGETSVDLHSELAADDPPEMLTLANRVGKAVPTVVRMRLQKSWSLPRPKLQQLTFTEVTGAEPERVSRLKGGTVRFNDTAGSKLEVREGDFVTLRDLERARVELRGEDGILHVTLNGSVGGVTLGEGDATREQMPSYLEYLYHQKSLGVVWSAILFLWGFLWSVRKVIVH